jgi:hypothetical protein
MLERLLRRRFLDASASLEQLERWAEQVVVARTVEDVFA